MPLHALPWSSVLQLLQTTEESAQSDSSESGFESSDTESGHSNLHCSGPPCIDPVASPLSSISGSSGGDDSCSEDENSSSCGSSRGTYSSISEVSAEDAVQQQAEGPAPLPPSLLTVHTVSAPSPAETYDDTYDSVSAPSSSDEQGEPAAGTRKIKHENNKFNYENRNNPKNIKNTDEPTSTNAASAVKRLEKRRLPSYAAPTAASSMLAHSRASIKGSRGQASGPNVHNIPTTAPKTKP